MAENIDVNKLQIVRFTSDEGDIKTSAERGNPSILEWTYSANETQIRNTRRHDRLNYPEIGSSAMLSVFADLTTSVEEYVTPWDNLITAPEYYQYVDQIKRCVTIDSLTPSATIDKALVVCGILTEEGVDLIINQIESGETYITLELNDTNVENPTAVFGFLQEHLTEDHPSFNLFAPIAIKFEKYVDFGLFVVVDRLAPSQTGPIIRLDLSSSASLRDIMYYKEDKLEQSVLFDVASGWTYDLSSIYSVLKEWAYWLDISPEPVFKYTYLMLAPSYDLRNFEGSGEIFNTAGCTFWDVYRSTETSELVILDDINKNIIPAGYDDCLFLYLNVQSKPFFDDSGNAKHILLFNELTLVDSDSAVIAKTYGIGIKIEDAGEILNRRTIIDENSKYNLWKIDVKELCRDIHIAVEQPDVLNTTYNTTKVWYFNKEGQWTSIIYDKK